VLQYGDSCECFLIPQKDSSSQPGLLLVDHLFESSPYREIATGIID